MKVAIVGAGIIGCYLGYKLSNICKITIFEKNPNIGKKVCSGLISERIWNFIPKNNDIIEKEFKKIIIHFENKDIELNLKQKLYALDRKKLDKYIFSLAKKSGIEFKFNTYISGINDKNLELFDKIIGCDGAFSKIRSSLHLKNPKFKLGIICYVKNKNFKNIEVWSCKSGFLWRFPRKKYIEYGILAEPKIAKEIFDRFLELESIIPNKLHSAYIPCGLIIPKSEKYTLCGDAAGITKPWSGGGVIWGFTAADLLIKNFPLFNKYRKSVYNSFFYKQNLYENLSKIITKINLLIPKNKFLVDTDFLF